MRRSATYLFPPLLLLAIASLVGRTVGSEHVMGGLSDPARHIVLYAALTAIVAGSACLLRGGLYTWPLVYGVVLCLLLGLTQELRQSWPDREFEWRDVCMNVVGSMAGAALVTLVGGAPRLFPRRAI